jgi:cell division protein FtsB
VSADAYRAPRRQPRRRPARRRGGSRVDWDRFGRVVLVIVLFLVLLSYLDPLLGLFHTWRDSRSEQQRLVELKRENAELKRRSAGLDDPRVLEEEARRQGMVRVGERSYVISGLPH